ncbi:MAG: deoxyguanosinetriphosphate triphosphohydrolase, partial [Firmicutes bacterium]|nr:deoxyguanosinetriphosphate triphosphohydrolase [Bacillota bacterium]
MVLREDIEKREDETLDIRACRSMLSKGRQYPEEKDLVRTDFQRDRDRIIHSKSFRRLMHKTQVFLAPEGDHFRTRLTHTLEVSQIARTIARALNYNEDLTEAIALGHDLGHTPFGHNGEDVLNKIHPGGFSHNVQSLRVVDVLEENRHRAGQGMNLTMEVRDGIVNHTGPVTPFTLEGQIVHLADRIAYINHDIDDALRSGVISFDDLPKSSVELFGHSHRNRINALVMDTIRNSDGFGEIRQSPEFRDEMNNLRRFMFERVYQSPIVKRDEDLAKVE